MAKKVLFKNRLIVAVFLMAILSFGCRKDNTRTWADGTVTERSSSVIIYNASIKLLHWDGHTDHDTAWVETYSCDSLGKFEFGFEAYGGEFYWVIAEKDGCSNSSWEPLDTGWTNGCDIKVDRDEK